MTQKIGPREQALRDMRGRELLTHHKQMVEDGAPLEILRRRDDPPRPRIALPRAKATKAPESEPTLTDADKRGIMAQTPQAGRGRTRTVQSRGPLLVSQAVCWIAGSP